MIITQIDNAATGDGNMDNTTTGETSTVKVPLPPCYGGKTKDPSKIKTSTKCTTTIAEPSIGDPLPDENATVKASDHTFDPTDVHMYEFLIQGAPNPCDFAWSFFYYGSEFGGGFFCCCCVFFLVLTLGNVCESVP